MAALLWVTPCAWGSPLPDASSPSEAGTARATPPAARFRLVVDAPEPVRAFLLTHLDLQRFSTLADLDRPELERLVALLPANAFNLLAALGYMAPEISARLEEPPVTDNLSTGATGTAAARELPTVVVTVKPGSPTVVTSVALSLTGDIATREEAADQRASVQQAFALILLGRLFGCLLFFLYLNVVFLGQIAQCLGIGHLLVGHDEVDRIATFTTAKALVNALGRRHAERWRLLVVEWAKPPKIGALLLEMHEIAHNLFHPCGVEYLSDGIFRYHGGSKVSCEVHRQFCFSNIPASISSFLCFNKSA